MNIKAQQSYLESQVLSASPQKLRLMLIDAALASARQTLESWQQDQSERAVETLIRCRDLVTELLAGIQPTDDPLSRRATAIYVFLFKALTEAQLDRDRGRVNDVIRVLEIERETWRQVCERLPHTIHPPNEDQQMPGEITASEAGRLLSNAGHEPPPSTGGFVFDA